MLESEAEVTTKGIFMQRGSTLYLRAAVAALAAAVLAICIFALPATWRAIGEEYPTITYVFYGILTAMYISAIPFFIALGQTLRLLGLVDKNKAFSLGAVKLLGRIKYCAAVISLIYAAILPLFYQWAQAEDAPGLIIICLVISLASLAVGVFAAVLQRLLRDAIKIKKENDLTV